VGRRRLLFGSYDSKNEWQNADHLGEQGWEFIAFVPNPEAYIRDSFTKEQLEGIRLAVFKRQMEDHEDMGWGRTRAN
jgi:hypothetical protein